MNAEERETLRRRVLRWNSENVQGIRARLSENDTEALELMDDVFGSLQAMSEACDAIVERHRAMSEACDAIVARHRAIQSWKYPMWYACTKFWTGILVAVSVWALIVFGISGQFWMFLLQGIIGAGAMFLQTRTDRKLRVGEEECESNIPG